MCAKEPVDQEERTCKERQPPTAYSKETIKPLKQSKFPIGWDEERVRRVLAYYEEQTEEEAVKEDEVAFADYAETPRLLDDRSKIITDLPGGDTPMRKCTKNDIKSMCEEKPALLKILRFLSAVGTTQSTEKIAAGTGLPVEETQETLDFVDEICRKGNFENPIDHRR